VKNDSALSLFLRSSLNPFQYCPPALGFESFTTTSLDTVWTRNFGQGGGTNTCFAVVFNPGVLANNSGALGTATESYLWYGAAPLSSTALSAYTSTNQPSPNGISNFTAEALLWRPVTAGVRVTVRYPMNSAPGRLFAANISDSDSNIAAKSIDALDQLDCAVPIAFDGSGVAAIQCNWRQMATPDFGFSTTSYNPPPSNVNAKSLIIGVGWPAGTVFDIETISHLEYTSGALPAGNVGDTGPSVALTTSVEQLGARMRGMPYVLDKSDILVCQRSALIAAMARLRSANGGRLSSSSSREVPSTVRIEEVVDAQSSGAGDYISVARSYAPSGESMARGAMSVAQLLAAEYVRRQGRLV